MRSKQELFELEEIPILLQYLYLNKDNYITLPPFNNKLYMDGDFHMKLFVVHTGMTISYDDEISINSLLGIIEYLKEKKYDYARHHIQNPHFKTEWDLIIFEVLAHKAIN